MKRCSGWGSWTSPRGGQKVRVEVTSCGGFCGRIVWPGVIPAQTRAHTPLCYALPERHEAGIPPCPLGVSMATHLHRLSWTAGFPCWAIRLLVTMTVASTAGCPVRSMPCNSDQDCDPVRNVCDTSQPMGDALGTCVFRLRGGTTVNTTGSSTDGVSSSGNATSTVPCTADCALGQRCVNNLCVCDAESCQGGCCVNNQCSLLGFHTRGEQGNTCLVCDDARADNCSLAGECRCGSAPGCTTGQVCIRGTCECYAATCAGCCQGSECRERSVEACGVTGSVCVVCDPVKADGCSPLGMCRCGNGPPCGLFKACINGNCVCDTQRCTGCCDNRVCTLSTMVACGVGGNECQQCDPLSADLCNAAGECVCGEGPQCAAGQACVEETCVCNQGSCPGCCDGTTCLPGDSDATCGAAGLGCEACEPGETCTDGVCTRCNAMTCPDGCCSANRCYLASRDTCGVGGNACHFCSPVGADGCSRTGACLCGAGPACREGQVCSDGSCTCGPQSCPQGCCQNGECQVRSPQSCGVGGVACTSCDPDTTDYCSSDGRCQCGSDAPCADGQRCIDGACVCDGESCMNGCCLGNECLVASVETCGAQGGLCGRCQPDLSDMCLADGTCSCGPEGPCLPGNWCVGGVCVYRGLLSYRLLWQSGLHGSHAHRLWQVWLGVPGVRGGSRPVRANGHVPVRHGNAVHRGRLVRGRAVRNPQ